MTQLKIKRKSLFNINNSEIGETLETKLQRIITNREPISDSSPTIYTDRRDGVIPQFNIRTDTFELAIEAHDTLSRQALAQREDYMKKLDELEGKEIEPPLNTDKTA